MPEQIEAEFCKQGGLPSRVFKFPLARGSQTHTREVCEFQDERRVVVGIIEGRLTPGQAITGKNRKLYGFKGGVPNLTWNRTEEPQGLTIYSVSAPLEPQPSAEE